MPRTFFYWSMDVNSSLRKLRPPSRRSAPISPREMLEDPNFDHFLEGNIRGPAGRADIVYDRLLAISKLNTS